MWKLKTISSINIPDLIFTKKRQNYGSNNTKVKWWNRTKHIFTFFSFPKRYAMQYKVVCTFTEMQIWTKIWNYVQQKLGGDTYKLQIRREAAWMELYFMLGEIALWVHIFELGSSRRCAFGVHCNVIIMKYLGYL